MRFAIIAAPVALATVASAITAPFPSDLVHPKEIFAKACDHFYPGYHVSFKLTQSHSCFKNGREDGKLCAVMECGPMAPNIGPGRSNNAASTQRVYDYLQAKKWTID